MSPRVITKPLDRAQLVAALAAAHNQTRLCQDAKEIDSARAWSDVALELVQELNTNHAGWNMPTKEMT